MIGFVVTGTLKPSVKNEGGGRSDVAGSKNVFVMTATDDAFPNPAGWY
jgi:hypothetical protein